MPVEEQLAAIFEVLEGGAEVPAGEIIQFPADVAGAGSALEGTTTTVELGNGIATEVSQLTVTEAGTTTTAGVGLIAMDVGAVGAAIAPALGILAGVGLYNLAPEFWDNVSNRLLEAGQTIGGKVRMYINSNTKELGVSEETLEIFKEAFIEAGLFEQNTTVVEPTLDPSLNDYVAFPLPFTETLGDIKIKYISGNTYYYHSNTQTTGLKRILFVNPRDASMSTFNVGVIAGSLSPFSIGNIEVANESYVPNPNVNITTPETIDGYSAYRLISYVGRTLTLNNIIEAGTPFILFTQFIGLPNSSAFKNIANKIINEMLFGETSHNPNLQEGAVYPNENPIPEIYPSWNPWSVPVEGFPNVYPIEVPAINPDPNQQQAQTPQEIPDNDPDALEWLIESLPQPDPNPDPYPEPSVNPDPDPAPEPEPIPDPEPEPTPENPVDPNPDPTPSPLPVVPDMPETVESNAMFTVYKPSMAQVNAFGGWLWSSSIVEAIKRIWQNPLDGIISFMKVYVDAPTSGSDTIKVGILDSEVSSPVVSGQFVTVECGSLNVREKFYNATDYSPFVGMHLYLPFIGIVELDIDEFMSGEIKVTYHVDVYTGTCLAEVKSRRSPDMPEWTIVYTFSGNASQQLPLTSAEFSGALSSLVGVVGGGLAIASGGGLGLLAGASGIAHAVSHEMVHLAHSGSLSANAGIMGARKPYLILTRRRGYDANGYNELYGYPSNKTVYLNNCSGYVKVKDIRLETVATDSERIEIESLLKAGVII